MYKFEVWVSMHCFLKQASFPFYYPTGLKPHEFSRSISWLEIVYDLNCFRIAVYTFKPIFELINSIWLQVSVKLSIADEEPHFCLSPLTIKTWTVPKDLWKAFKFMIAYCKSSNTWEVSSSKMFFLFIKRFIFTKQTQNLIFKNMFYEFETIFVLLKCLRHL